MVSMSRTNMPMWRNFKSGIMGTSPKGVNEQRGNSPDEDEAILPEEDARLNTVQAR
jgi:hypothetical protein